MNLQSQQSPPGLHVACTCALKSERGGGSGKDSFHLATALINATQTWPQNSRKKQKKTKERTSTITTIAHEQFWHKLNQFFFWFAEFFEKIFITCVEFLNYLL